MKLFTNLPWLLRILFSWLRVATVVMAVFWLLVLTYNTWIQQHFGRDSRFMTSVGTIALPAKPGALGLESDTAGGGSLSVHGLRANLQVDLASQDGALGSVLRRAIVPSMVAIAAFSFVLFTSLQKLCGNLARGEVFNEANLRHVRWIGLNLIAYSLVGAGLELWASYVLGVYFGDHVTLTGLQTAVPFGVGPNALQFSLTPGLVTTQGGVLIGCLVLVVAEAFRQGLKLKTENDLTV